ncbi:hypothetical protein ACM64Y_19495 [Novispirillum sp. DQ9]|uniref:3'-5' exonuclease n=1 Tax=Novispirillum sp. DQ9 TaxID=3398612 RepID=UPI003C7C9B37
MRVFIDVEASSLRNGFPVEVAWCAEGLDRAATYLIRPEPAWWECYDWTAEAQAMHGLDRATLERIGRPRAEVAASLAEDLAGAEVHSDNAAFDTGWLAVLYGGAAPPFSVGLLRPAGTLMLTSEIGLRRHRALDDAVALAMAFGSDRGDGDAATAEARGREILRRLGRR